MRFFAVTILLIALLAQNCSRYMLMLGFELNREYIAKNLCENREKPRSCCKGKCFLKKQLAKTDKEEGSTNNLTNNKDKNEVLFFAEMKNRHTYYYTSIVNREKYSLRNSINIPTNIVGEIFHPPQV